MKNIREVIGIMSGTSLDGTDLAYCRFEWDDLSRFNYSFLKTECVEYSKLWKEKLQNAHYLSGQELLFLDQQFGKYIGNLVNSFIEQEVSLPDLIASHGHTIFHQPGQKLSFQLGSGAAIYATTNIPVVCDFRSVDVNLGGQGAPLVPVGDALLFKEYDFCLNLGGIANISFNDTTGKRIAFDICGCNLLLNTIANEIGLDYDHNGQISAKGKINPELLETLSQWHYYKLKPPKSLDKETMLSELIPVIGSFQINNEDKMATIAEHIAMQISKVAGNSTGKMLVTGGGAFNMTLINNIEKHSNINIVIPSSELIQFKEALIFAFLGNLRVLNKPNTLSSVTGAAHDSIGGALYGGI